MDNHNQLSDVKLKSVILPWVIAFFLMNILGPQSGGTNEKSRFALLRAMAEQATFIIDDYKEWTYDWAQTPDGHYYSNKGPAPMFMSFPIFYPLDRLYCSFQKKNEKGLCSKKVPGIIRIILSLLFQVLPFGIVTLMVVKYLHKQFGVPLLGLHFAALGILFGNTATMFMSSFFGHGIAAITFLLTTYFVLKRRFIFAGLFFGITLLTEYSSAVLLPPLLIFMIWQNGRNFKWLPNFILGGVIPGILWIWYHYICFGSIFNTPVHFQNPDYIDMKEVKNNFLGIFAPYPMWDVIIELLIGLRRGLIYTQPWILLIIPMAITRLFNKKIDLQTKHLIVLIILSFLSLFMLNASFGSWYAGNSSGPRYLAMVLPLFALIAAALYSHLHLWEKRLLWATLAITIIFNGMVFMTTNKAPPTALWEYHFSMIVNGGSKVIVRGIIFVGLFFFAIARIRSKNYLKR